MEEKRKTKKGRQDYDVLEQNHRFPAEGDRRCYCIRVPRIIMKSLQKLVAAKERVDGEKKMMWDARNCLYVVVVL